MASGEINGGGGWMGQLLARLVASPQVFPLPDGGTALHVPGRSDPAVYHGKQEQQTHVFHDPDDLIAYVSGLETDVVIGVDGSKAGSERIVAMVDPHTPNHSTVTCPLPYAPVFDAWNTKFRSADAGHLIGQDAFHELVRFFGEAVRMPERDVLLGDIGTLRVAEGQNLKVEIDMRGTTRFRGGEATAGVDGSLPSELVIASPMFEYSDDEATFHVKLTLQVKDGRAFFRLNCPGLERVRREEVVRIVAKVREKIGSRPVYAAALATRTVEQYK